MKKVSFNERRGIRKYILHESVPTPINVVEISDDGWTLKTDTGELLEPPCYDNKGDFFALKMEGRFYKIEEDIGFSEEHDGPWDEDPFLYEKGMVVTLEGTEDEKEYIFDGWCNLYRRSNGEKGDLAKDCHPHVALFFT